MEHYTGFENLITLHPTTVQCGSMILGEGGKLISRDGLKEVWGVLYSPPLRSGAEPRNFHISQNIAIGGCLSQ